MKFKDIELFKPQFVRVARARGDNIVFDYVNGDYRARDKDKHRNLTFKKFVDSARKEDILFEYHISLRNVEDSKALLVFESDTDNSVIIKLSGLVRERGLRFILKTSGSRSLHLIIAINCDNEKLFNEMWDMVYNLWEEKDREKIDIQLKKYNGQVRGFYSTHLKTNAVSRIISGRL